MSKLLHSTFFFLVLLMACSPTAHYSGNANNVANHHTASTQEVQPVTISHFDTVGAGETDSFAGKKPLSLMDLPQTEDGKIVLSEGFYETEFKSYCLQPGTPSPSDRDAYLQAPLTGYRKDIIETILRNSLKRPDLEQRNIQLLLWSVVSGSDFRKNSWEVQSTAEQLLSSKQIFELKGGVVGVVKTVSAALPETGVNSANYKLKQLFELGTNSYDAYERIAVLQQPSELHKVQAKKDQWYKQQEGFYLRYFPSGYQQVKVQVFVPAGTLDTSSAQRKYLLFDPVTVMAVPASSNAQRLGIGAPVSNIIRKIIQIQQVPPTPKKLPVKTNNPKQVVSK